MTFVEGEFQSKRDQGAKVSLKLADQATRDLFAGLLALARQS
jgi:hypothetical protein